MVGQAPKPGPGTWRTPSSRALNLSANHPLHCLYPVLQISEVPLSLVVGTELRVVPKSCEETFSHLRTMAQGFQRDVVNSDTVLAQASDAPL